MNRIKEFVGKRFSDVTRQTTLPSILFILSENYRAVASSKRAISLSVRVSAKMTNSVSFQRRAVVVKQEKTTTARRHNVHLSGGGLHSFRGLSRRVEPVDVSRQPTDWNMMANRVIRAPSRT